MANPNPNSAISNKQSELGKEIRKQYGDLIEADFSYAQMMAKINNEIEKTTGMKKRDFNEHVQRVNGDVFLPFLEFQQKALKAYQNL